MLSKVIVVVDLRKMYMSAAYSAWFQKVNKKVFCLMHVTSLPTLEPFHLLVCVTFFFGRALRTIFYTFLVGPWWEQHFRGPVSSCWHCWLLNPPLNILNKHQMPTASKRFMMWRCSEWAAIRNFSTLWTWNFVQCYWNTHASSKPLCMPSQGIYSLAVIFV